MSEYEIDKIDEIDEIDELDDSWITEIEKEEEDYNSFYKEENETIKLVCIYINNKNKIYYVKKESIILENKILGGEYFEEMHGSYEHVNPFMDFLSELN